MPTTENKVRKGHKPKLGKFTSQYPILVARCNEYGIDIPTFQPYGNNCIVWRLPPLTESAGGIIIPEDQQSPHVKGILLSAGPQAMDTLESNGITLGHVVIFQRFAGWETNDSTPEYQRHNRILMIKDREIVGSDDLRVALESGRAKYIRGADGRHTLQVKLISDKKQKLLALASDPGATSAERATAKRIAKEME